MNISELLARNARKFPNKVGFISEPDRLTYKEVDEKVTRLAHALKTYGIMPGDKVILFSPNTIEFVYSYFAVQRLGAIIVPINAKLSTGELKYIIEHSEAKAFIGHHLLWTQVAPLTNDYLVTWISIADGVDGAENIYDLIENGSTNSFDCQLKEDDLSTILYTSGTTGQPKGVLFPIATF